MRTPPPSADLARKFVDTRGLSDDYGIGPTKQLACRRRVCPNCNLRGSVVSLSLIFPEPPEDKKKKKKKGAVSHARSMKATRTAARFS